MQQQHYYVYIQFRPNGVPFYVGKGKGRRWKELRKRSKHYLNIINKYGREKIATRLIYFKSEQEAFDAEKRIIQFYRHCEFPLCNITSGGEGAANPPAAIRARIAAAQRGHKRSNLTRLKMTLAKAGLVHSPETREKISQSKKGIKHTAEARAKISAGLRGRPVSAETRAKIGAANRRKRNA
jgi:hypothetical protein